MSRTHSKHLQPKQYRERQPHAEALRMKRVTKSHKQKRPNERTALRKEFL